MEIIDVLMPLNQKIAIIKPLIISQENALSRDKKKTLQIKKLINFKEITCEKIIPTPTKKKLAIKHIIRG